MRLTAPCWLVTDVTGVCAGSETRTYLSPLPLSLPLSSNGIKLRPLLCAYFEMFVRLYLCDMCVLDERVLKYVCSVSLRFALLCFDLPRIALVVFFFMLCGLYICVVCLVFCILCPTSSRLPSSMQAAGRQDARFDNASV